MNSKRLRNILIVCIILLVIVIISIIINFITNKNYGDMHIDEYGENILETYGKNGSGGIDEQSYFDIKTCMQSYLDCINIDSPQYYSRDNNGKYVRNVEENIVKQKIYNLLSSKYINEKNITIENIYDKIEILKDSSIFVPIEASLIQDGDIKSFLIHGLVESTSDYRVIDKIFAIVNINVSEGVFSIEPIYGEYTNISEINIESFEDRIISNNDNKYSMNLVNYEKIIKEYIILVKRLALGTPEELYKLLNEEYKNIKFGNIEEFKNFIEKNREKIKSARLEKYKVIHDKGQIRYVCIDQYENYYIINQKEILQNYTIMLDRYTVDLPEFIEKYQTSDVATKVALNIEKIKEAINLKDFTYVYNKTDNTFKDTKFSSFEAFEKYLQSNLFEENSFEYKNVEVKGGIYVATVVVTDKSNKSAVSKEMTVMMSLDNDSTNYKISFNFGE